MKKRILSLILALAMLCTLLPQAALTASAEVYSGSCGAEGDNLTWSFDTETGLLTITGSGAMTDYDNWNDRAPWYDYREAITAFSLPEGLTSIGDSAFKDCRSLTSVTIPDSVTSIGFGAFEECRSLTSVTIPDSVLSVGWYSFHDCSSLSSVTIGNGVTSIGGAAFSDCVALTSVSIGSSVTGICDQAFDYCTSLIAFFVSSDNQSFISIDGVLFDKAQTELIQYPAKKPDAHYVIPSSVTSISNHAFSDCTLLTDVVIPANVNSISHFAFKTCVSLTGFTVDCDNAVYSSMDGILLNREKTNLIQYPIGKANSTYTIPDSVTSIEMNAFLNCSNLTSVTVPESVTSIGGWAFGYYEIRMNVEMGARVRYDDFTVYGYNGTAAQDYAAENEFAFISLDNAVGEFVDVTPTDYFADPVLWAINHEPAITAGVGVHSFGPNNPCTREQIVTFLWAANGKPAPAGTGSTFSDVPADAWYYKPVMWAVENGYTSGMGDGSFGVGQPCTRAQAMTFLWAAKGKPAPSSLESTFSDVSSGDWFCKAILWAAENGITKGVGNGLFGVNNTCTRAQIITFLYKAYK